MGSVQYDHAKVHRRPALVAFGVGIHRCIGASLARMEIKVAARELLKRVGDIALAAAVEEIGYLPTVATHSIEKLPLTFSRRR